MERMQEDMEKGGTERFTERQASALAAKAEKDRIAQEAKEKAEREAYLAELAKQKAKSLATKRQQEKIAKEKAERDRRERERREREQNNQNYDSGNDNYGGDSSIGGEGGLDASSGVGGGGGWTATGGFINKKKMIMHKGAPKKNKRMKRGGLASR
jgi:membrane protein involved in colicin uptake